MAEITNKLLKQAIADAEAVRETAVANAKLVLEEAITPQIKEMIARRLRLEAEMATETEDHEKAKEVPNEEAEAEHSSETPQDTSAIGTGDNKEPSDDSWDSSEVGDGGENKEDSHTDWYDDWSEKDFDLNEIIAELEADIASLSETSHEEEEEEEEEEMDEAKKHEEEEEKEEEEQQDESWKAKKEVSQPTHDSDVQKYSKAPVHEEEEEEEEEDGLEKTAQMQKHMEKKEKDHDVSLEEILAVLEAEESEEKDHSDKEKMAAKLAELKNELAQYRDAVGILRGRLQEVNLLNAKLLYTNKLFKKEGLNNDQKIRIVESFDRATTLREVKLVYTALVENLAVAAKTFNASRKKVVAEGFASKATPTTAPKSEVIVENTVAKRLQQLAGII